MGTVSKWQFCHEILRKIEKVCHCVSSRAYIQAVKLVARTEAYSSALRFRAFRELYENPVRDNLFMCGLTATMVWRNFKALHVFSFSAGSVKVL